MSDTTAEGLIAKLRENDMQTVPVRNVLLAAAMETLLARIAALEADYRNAADAAVRKENEEIADLNEKISDENTVLAEKIAALEAAAKPQEPSNEERTAAFNSAYKKLFRVLDSTPSDEQLFMAGVHWALTREPPDASGTEQDDSDLCEDADADYERIGREWAKANTSGLHCVRNEFIALGRALVASGTPEQDRDASERGCAKTDGVDYRVEHMRANLTPDEQRDVIRGLAERIADRDAKLRELSRKWEADGWIDHPAELRAVLESK